MDVSAPTLTPYRPVAVVFWAPVFAPADIVGTDLVEVVDGLLQLPEPAIR